MSLPETKRPRLFGTSGIRGVVPHDLSPELLVNAGKAIASSLKPHSRVLIATDTRISRDRVKASVQQGLMSCGVDIVDAGILPTPVLAFATVAMGMDTGIMLTASHNPPEYNGVKLFNANGIGYSPEQETAIEDIYYSHNFRPGANSKLSADNSVESRYVKYLLSTFNPNADQKKLSVLVDPGNGAASGIAARVFKAFGYPTYAINDEPDGTFPNRSSEPNQESLKNTYRYLLDNNIDLGICFDGDADRVVFIDKYGVIGFTESVSYMSYLAVKRTGKKRVAATVETGRFIDKALAGEGVEVVRGKVGDVHVAHLAQKTDAAIGVEPVGVYIMPELGLYPNSIAAALTLLAATGNEPDIREFINRTPPLHLEQRKIPCGNENKEAVKLLLIQNAHVFGGKANTLDGLRVDYDDAFVLIRPSGTEPIFRIIAESPTRQETERLLDFASVKLQGYLAEIGGK